MNVTGDAGSGITGVVDMPSVAKELRIAVTMNGGVSLAVYIGGVAHELNRLTAANSDYRRLLQAFGYRHAPVIDVITGTSAGGINAAALALAQANTNADLAVLRDMWIEHGQISDLLRNPFENAAPSLLKGDEFLYPKIRSAFLDLIKDYKRSMTTEISDIGVDEGQAQSRPRPIDLTITATLLAPVPAESVDDLGTRMVQPKHAGLFRFTTAERHTNNTTPDMFAAPAKVAEPNVEDLANVRRTVEALALAARATASFPVAFEPTFIPVNYPGKCPDGRPDMADYVNGEWCRARMDRSRYAVDGGVLANTPIRQALSAIRRQQVSGTLVRRVLVLVHPHAAYADDFHDLAGSVEAPPTLLRGLAGVLGASSSVGSLTYVEDVKKHNEQALRWRDARRSVLSQLKTPTGIDGFLTGDTWQLVRSLRKRRCAYVLAHQIRDQVDVPLTRLIEYAAAILECQDDKPGSDGLPFLPKDAPAAATFRSSEWRWGLDVAHGVASLATDLLKTVIVAPAGPSSHPSNDMLLQARTAWRTAVNGGVELESLGLVEEETASNDAQGSAAVPEAPTARSQTNQSEKARRQLKTNFESHRTRMCPTDQTTQDGAETPGGRVSRVLGEIAEQMYKLITMLNANTPTAERTPEAEAASTSEAPRSTSTASLMDPSNPLRSRDIDGSGRLLELMVKVSLIAYSLGEEDLSESSAHSGPIDFAQLSAQVRQHFAPDFRSDDKLAGMSLNRFGAFLKRSWRANDWIWGRLDAVKVVMLLLITPQMVRGLAASTTATRPEDLADRVVKRVVRLSTKFEESNYRPVFFRQPKLKALKAAAVEEVVAALNGDDKQLENLASLAAYGFQMRVAEEEVTWLAETIRDDIADGATGFQTAAFLHRFEQLDVSRDPDRGHKLLTLFAEAGIGREEVAEQLPSDLMIRTTATAAATAVSTLTSERSGLEIARPLTRTAKAAVSVPYWILMGLSQQGRVGRTVAAIALALGVSLLTLGMITKLPGVLNTVVPTVGIASLVTVLVYATLRTQSVVHGAALLGILIPIGSFAVHRLRHSDPPERQQGSSDALLTTGGSLFLISCIAVLIVGVVLVANLRTGTKSPLASLVDLARRTWRSSTGRLAIGALLIVAPLAWWQWERLPWIATALADFGKWLHDTYIRDTRLIVLTAIGIAAFGIAVAWVKSWRFRPHEDADDRRRLSDPAGLATAWAPIYGSCFLGLAVSIHAIRRADSPEWTEASVWLLLLFGAFFCIVVVQIVPYLRERRIVARIVTRYAPQQLPTETESLVRLIRRIGPTAGYLLTDPPEGSEEEALSRHGWRVIHRARRRLAAYQRNPSALSRLGDSDTRRTSRAHTSSRIRVKQIRTEPELTE
ncbi:hypothetical protein B1R94_12835 [Mycolicibacterium litorale]|nr:hypothetical protein B1R94_12835 [Mycolicibacterium litorale]